MGSVVMSGQNADKRIRAVETSAYVCSNTRLTGDLWQLVLHTPIISGAIAAGQFVHLSCGDTGKHILRRPFSIHEVYQSPQGIPERLSLLYQVVGEGTSCLTTVREGMSLGALGPLGHGWQVPDETSCALLVGGGVGFAPLVLLAELLLDTGREVHVLLGARNADYLHALVSKSHYDTLVHNKTRALDGESYYEHFATDDGSLGFHGMNTELLGSLLDRYDFDYIATCGPEPMQKIVAAHAVDRGISCEVSLERRMGCGMGVCLSCVVQTTKGSKRACLDGPVFDAREVIW